MPQPVLTQEDRQYLIKQGIDPDSFVPQEQEQEQPMSKLGAVKANLIGRAGGNIGGGAGVLGAGSLALALAPWLAGPEAGIPADLALAGVGALGGTAGSILGQKAQHGIQSDETNAQQAQELEQANREHPLVSLATDIGASALASGGSPSLSTPLRALAGDKQALRSVLLNSAVNPAINSGINYATTGQLPSISDVGAQALGGAVMSGNKNPLSRILGLHQQEPTDKVNVPEPQEQAPEQAATTKAPLGGVLPDVSSTASGLKYDTGITPKQGRGYKKTGPIDYLQPKNQEVPEGQLNAMTGEGGPEPLEVGDQVEAQTDTGIVKGYKVGEDAEGNHQIATEGGDVVTLPKEEPYRPSQEELNEGLQEAEMNEEGEQNANQIESPVGNVSDTSSTDTKGLAEGESSGVQQAAGTPTGEEEGLQNEERLARQRDFEKAQAELQARNPANVQTSQEWLGARKGTLSPNALKSVNPNTLLPHDISRPEQAPKSIPVHEESNKANEGNVKVVNPADYPDSENYPETDWRHWINKAWTGEEGSIFPTGQRKTLEEAKAKARQGLNIKTGEGPGKEAGAIFPSFLHKSTIENVEDINRPEGKLIGKAARKVYQEQQSLQGRFVNPVVKAGKALTPKDMARINQIKYQEDSSHILSPPTAQDSAAVRNFYNVAKKLRSDSGDYAIQNKIPIMDAQGKARLMKKSDTRWAGMPNQSVEDVYRKNTDAQKISDLDKAFDNWNQNSLGMTPKESAKRIANFKISIQGDMKGTTVSHQDWFNAMRKEAGSPLPPEFREPNPVKNEARYYDRFATAAAFYKHIESHPDIMGALGATEDPWGHTIKPNPNGSLANNPSVQQLLNQFHHSPETMAERREQSLSGVATAGLIAGPPLEVHKVVSNEVKAISLARNPVQAAASLVHALTNIKQGYQHAEENGVIKLTAASIKDMFDGTLTAAERMNGVARAIRQVATLGDLTTKFNAGLMQAQMEYIVPKKIQNANSGKGPSAVTDQKFLQRLDPDYTVGTQYSTKEIQDLASTAAKYIHGTGDARQMPGWMLDDSEVSGFFSLAHWTVAQTNNFVHDILEPAQRGDVTPLLTSVFGAAIGGYLIKELRQDISGKKNPIPSLQEIQASEGGMMAHKSLLAYNLIAAMQYSGFGGLLSQIAKYPFDFAYKNQPQGATFPLDELASDLASTVHNVSSAIANDPNVNWIDLASAVGQHVFQNNVMLSRIAINQGINAGLITGLPAEKKNLSDRLNQLRRFDEIQGLPYSDIDTASNPFMNLEQKKFKYSQDPQEAVKQLPEMISGIMSAYAGKPDVIMSKLKALKQNDYDTFPSMKEMPLEFMKYMGYLSNLKGPQAAQDELQDYMKHKMINEVKSSVIP